MSEISLKQTELPLACALSEPDLMRRREEISGTVFKGCQHIDELPDGYGFRFPGDAEWALRLAEFITFERKCCPFFRFELLFEPGQEPVWLRLTGQPGTKEFILAELGEAFGIKK